MVYLFEEPYLLWVIKLLKCSYALLYIFMLVFCILDSSPFPSSIPHAFQINFNSLYTALCEQQSDQATLLLYTLLHQNSNVRTYVLARTDMENLVSITRNILCLILWAPRNILCNPQGHSYFFLFLSADEACPLGSCNWSWLPHIAADSAESQGD